MNWNLGLKRVSAAWWGLVAIIAAGIGFTWGSGWELESSLAGMAWSAGAYALHRVTCWIINGFSAEKVNVYKD